MKFLLLSTSVLFGWATASAQAVVGIEMLSAKEIKPWVAASPSAYAGSYHFGFSECESVFDLHISKGVDNAAKTYTPNMSDMRLVTKKFTHVRIIGNKSYSDQATGEFVIFAEIEGGTHGLKIYKPWSCSTPKGKAEIGSRL